MRDLSIRAERRLHLLTLFCDAQTRDPLAAAQKAEAWVFQEEDEEELEPEIAEPADDDPWGNGTPAVPPSPAESPAAESGVPAGAARDGLQLKDAIKAFLFSSEQAREGFSRAEIIAAVPGWAPQFYSKTLTALVNEGVLIREGWAKTSRYWPAAPRAEAPETEAPIPEPAAGERPVGECEDAADEPAACEGGLIPYAGKHDFHGFTTGLSARESCSKPKAEPVKRNCLSCGKGFTAEGRFQRMCPYCRDRADSTPYDPI